MTDKDAPEKPETPGMAEVSPKFVDEADAATGEPPSSASVPTDPLLALRAERKSLTAELEATPEDEDAALWPRLEDVEKRILTAEPQTLLGALAQIEVLASMAHEGLPDFATEMIAGMDKQIPARFERLLAVSSRGAAEAAASVAEPGDAVVMLRQRWENVRAEREQLKHRDDDPKHPDVIEDERLRDVQRDIEKSIANAPTRTAAGIAVKLRQLQTDDEDFDGMSAWRPAAFRTALEALGQGIMPAIEDPVIALKREWDARWKRYANETDNSDEVTDPLHERLNETAYQIFQTPATTLAGIAFKLVIWARYHLDRDREGTDDWSRPPVTAYRSLDLDHLPVVSALHDLERMAGRGIVANNDPRS